MILELMNKDLDLDKDYILKVAKKNTAYKKYKIPKKNGKWRTIYHPSKELKLLQYWVVKRIFSKFPISESSMAYSKGNSIKNNALYHKNSKYILHLDISKFFENITHFHLDKLLDKIEGISNEDIKLIKNIVFYEGKNLVVGSSASPIISNCIMKNIDDKILKISSENGELLYTRYADDMIISSNNYIEINIIQKIRDILRAEYFELNEEKTYFMNKSCKRTITGIVIDNNDNTLSIGSEKYRKFKRELYKFLIKKEGDKDKILGYLAFIKDIDPKRYNNLKVIYSKYDREKSIFL
ncbi:MAG: retron St85 family RNA-directed DNA polymerase [Sarcina sp.]